MRSVTISTLSLMNMSRSNLNRMQGELVRLSQEVATGRMADVGLSLGASVARSVTLHIDNESLDAIARSNTIVGDRMRQSQLALDTMRTGADSFLNDVMTAMTSEGVATIVRSAQLGLNAFIGAANASDGRDFLFAGINTGVPPIAAYDDGPGLAVTTAFQAKFGFPPGDPAASGIDAATMTDFLDNEFADLFADPAWGATWSTASDELVANRISLTEKVNGSVSANTTAMRKLAQVYTMVGYLGMEEMGVDARQAILDKAVNLVGDVRTGIIDLQAGIGAAQNQIVNANDRIAAQQSMLANYIGELEGSDPVEAKIQIDTLGTQIQMSYSLTARLLQMSIINYA